MDSSSSKSQKGLSGENRSISGRKQTRRRNRKTGDSPGTEGTSRPPSNGPAPGKKTGFFSRLLRFFGLGTGVRPATDSKTGPGRKRKKRESITAEVTGCRLYVGNLAYEVSETDLKNLFATVGNVVTAEIVTNPQTSKSKGFGFVEMGGVEEARRAVERLNDTEFMGRSMLVTGALSEGRKCRVAEKKPASPRSRRESDREDGRRKKRQKKERGGAPYAEEENERSAPMPKEVARVTSPRLRVDNLDSEITEDLLRGVFDGFGAMVALELSGASAQIEMSSIEEAQRVVEVLNGKMFMGRRLKISEVKEKPPGESGSAASASAAESPE